MGELYELPNGWEWKSINDVCKKITDGAHKSPKTIEIGKPYITVKDVNDNGLIDFNSCKFISDEDFELLVKGNCQPENGDVLFSKDGTVGKVALVDYDIDFVVLSSLAILRPSENILSEYLKNYLLSPYFLDKAIKSKTGAAIKRVVLKTIKELAIPLPPLSEQQRIVSKIDILFEKIDKAIALHQKNMDETDVFMGSVLNDVFGELEEKYGLKQIQSLFKIKSGDFLPKKKMVEDGDINVYGGNGINGTHNEFNLSGENIIIGRVGALCGNVRCVNGYIWVTDNAFYVSEYFEDIDKNYLTQMLIHINLGSSANQAAQPVISYKGISAMELPLPPLNVQQKVVKYLDEISQKIEKVKSVQDEKMESLKALKASILDKAFRGGV